MALLICIVWLAGGISRDRRGVAALEFALVATVMLILLLGGYDVANVIQIRLQLQQALRVGGQYAMAYPTQDLGNNAAGQNGIILAVKQALPNLPNVTVPSPVMSPSAGDGPPYYMTLTASAPYTPLLILGPTIENSVTYVVRFQ
jgi:Flp pilus assembly protein TadG